VVISLGFLCLFVHGVLTSAVRTNLRLYRRRIHRRGEHLTSARKIVLAAGLFLISVWDAFPALFGLLCAGVALWHAVRAFRQ
jgi:hypothetical protein